MSSTKGKTLYFNDKSMDYVNFGKEKKSLVTQKLHNFLAGFYPLQKL